VAAYFRSGVKVDDCPYSIFADRGMGFFQVVNLALLWIIRSRESCHPHVLKKATQSVSHVRRKIRLRNAN